MPIATAAPSQLLEVVQSSREIRVDKEAGVIRGVRVLGPESLNGRQYTPAAIRGAVHLYEGIHVNYDHPSKANAERQFADRAGWLQNVRESSGGLAGDLHFLKADPRADKLCEAAERRPESFGLSHNAEGRIVKRDGKTLVEEITRVRSVDVVADPATTRSLFESLDGNGEEPDTSKGVTNMAKKTMRQIAEANHKTNTRAAGLLAFLEQDGLPMADMPVEAPAEDPNAEIAAAFEKAALSILKKLFAGDMDTAEGFGKIKELLGQKEKAAADSGTATPDAAAPSPESLQADVRRLQAEIGIRDQLQESGVKATPARVKALVALDATERKELVESWKQTGQANQSQRPASTSVRNIPESELPKTAKEFAAAILD